MPIDLLIVFSGGTLTALLSWVYFRRCAISRPPIGVFNMRDVATLVIAIAVIPYIYLELPLIAVAAVLTITITGILYFTLEPVLRRPAAIVAVAATAVAADIVLSATHGTSSNTFLAFNDALMVLAVVGIANLWAQSGMGARELTALAASLAVYDFIATTQLTTMIDLIGRLSEIPFAPFLAWDAASDGIGVGLGDLLLLSAFPLAMRKSFGRTPGLVALGVGIATLGAVLLVLEIGLITSAIPVMVALGPLMVAQYALWSRRLPQRTTWQYLRAEPLARDSAPA